jgi:hypothetical protein
MSPIVFFPHTQIYATELNKKIGIMDNAYFILDSKKSPLEKIFLKESYSF